MKGKDSISPPTDGSEKLYQFCLDFFFTEFHFPFSDLGSACSSILCEFT